MKAPFARLLRALFFAIVVAGGVATITLVAEDVCGNPLACFEPGQEGELWQALEPIGETNDQDACINSEHPDPNRVRELERQCIYAPHTQLMPPLLGQMLDPFNLAVDGERIYVSDQSNHRVQVFKFDGTPIPLEHPIGDGIPGEGAYGPYPAEPRLTGHSDPFTGVRLTSPDGLAVDAAHRLIVGDFSGGVTVFNPNGEPTWGSIAAPGRLMLPNDLCYPDDGDPETPPFCLTVKATGVAISAGTTVRGFGVDPQGDPGRIVITDRLSSVIFIYDAGFNLIKRIPETIPAGAEPNSACVWDYDAPLGTFCTPVSAAIDNAGHIFVSEYDNNRIQVFDLDGNPLGYFGTLELQLPWGITIDHRGRLVIADTEAQRIAFYNVTFPFGAPVGTFLFELDAAGTLDGFPTAVAAQQGSGSGLDPAGRIIVTDTLNNRIQRFQLPDLVILNPQVDVENGTGTFQVAVPAAKSAAVADVGVSVQGVNATVLTLNGVSPANDTPLGPANTAEQNAAIGPTTIQAGQIATYAFTFAADAEAAVEFIFQAVGNDGLTEADPKEVNGELPCVTCVSTHTFYKLPVTGPPVDLATAGGGWYGSQLVARINATTQHPAGLAKIAFQFLSGPESAGTRWGGLVHEVAVSGAAASTDITILSEGLSSFRYWAIGADGTVEASHFVTVQLDLQPPTINYTIAPAANAAGWNKTDVTGTFTHTDLRSGPVFTGTGTFSFTSEGRGLFVEQTATDLAGNTSPVPTPSYSTGNGGRIVNIDKTAPVFDSVPPDVTIFATMPGFGVIPASTFDAVASDPALNDARDVPNKAGSGVVSVTNPGTHQFPMGASNWTFTATDAAGNTASQTRKVTVISPPSTLVYTGQTTVQYGQPLAVSATVTPAFASGAVSFTLAGNIPVSGTLSGGSASASIAQVLNNVVPGTYTLTLNYPGDGTIAPMQTTATISVTPAPITVTAAAKTKVYGDNDPAFTYQVTSGQLFGTDGFTGALSRVAGSNVGTYAITQGTLALSSNYAVTFVGANLTITVKPATLTANNTGKMFSLADPPLTTTPSGFLAGDGIVFSASRQAGEAVGTYVITPSASGTKLTNYDVTYTNGVFTISPYTNQPPVCTTAYGGEIWPPNHKKFYVAPINGVTDPDGGPISILVTGIWQDEEIDSTGDGKFSPDGQGVGTSTAWVRAERNGNGNKKKGNGRVYEILFTATDSVGATCSGSVFYTVPHDRGQRATAIDDGVRYDSTGVIPGARDKSQIHQKSPTP